VRQLELAVERQNAASIKEAAEEIVRAARHGTDADARIDRLVTARAVVALVRALDRARLPSEAADAVVGALKNIACSRGEAPKTVLVASGAVPKIMQYLGVVPTGSAAAERACRTLWNITLGRSRECREAVVRAGAVAVLVRTLNATRADTEVANCAVGALKQIACEDNSEEHKDRLVHDGALAALLRILQAAEPGSKVAEKVARTLWHIAMGPSDARRHALLRMNAKVLLTRMQGGVRAGSEAEKCASGALHELGRAEQGANAQAERESARVLAAERAKREAESKAQAEKARAEAAERAKREAESKAQAERARAEAAEKARREADRAQSSKRGRSEAYTFRKGAAVIMNNWKFDRLDDLMGHDVDAKSLKETLALVGFTVLEVAENLKGEEIVPFARGYAMRDYEEFDALMFVLLSHGYTGTVSGVDSKAAALDDIFSLFRPNVCPSLANKPKIFIVDACRGGIRDEEIPVAKGLPAASADFLIAYASPEGYVSWSNSSSGSYFIASLCKVMKEQHQSDHLGDMLTTAKRMVNQERMPQAPETVDRLQKKLYLL